MEILREMDFSRLLIGDLKPRPSRGLFNRSGPYLSSSLLDCNCRMCAVTDRPAARARSATFGVLCDCRCDLRRNQHRTYAKKAGGSRGSGSATDRGLLLLCTNVIRVEDNTGRSSDCYFRGPGARFRSGVHAQPRYVTAVGAGQSADFF
jgi:hypothetical protein